jgi:antitoxin HigA-1
MFLSLVNLSRPVLIISNFANLINRLSKEIAIPQTRVSEILRGGRRITADAALRLSRFFGNSAKFWLGLQDDYDIEDEQRDKKKDFDSIRKFNNAA